MDWIHADVAFWQELTPQQVRECLASGESRDAGDKNNRTPLHRAAAFNPDAEVIRAFLQAGADIGGLDKHGRTALHQTARWNNSPSVILALLEGGADGAVLDKKGRTAFDYAIKNKAFVGTDILDVLRKASLTY